MLSSICNDKLAFNVNRLWMYLQYSYDLDDKTCTFALIVTTFNTSTAIACSDL